MIYALQPIDGGPVKIGTTEDLPVRLRQLERRYRQPLAVLTTFPGGRDEEQAIHQRFAHLRLVGGNRRGQQPEQFRPTAELMTFLGRPLLVDANPDAVEAMPPVFPWKPVRLDLTPELHRKLRVVAAEEGKSMSTFARDLIEEAVERLYSGRGKG